MSRVLGSPSPASRKLHQFDKIDCNRAAELALETVKVAGTTTVLGRVAYEYLFQYFQEAKA
jgi:hypothetical protein